MNKSVNEQVCLHYRRIAAVERLSDFYKMVLMTTSAGDDEIHQEILTEGAVLAAGSFKMGRSVFNWEHQYVIDPSTSRPWGAKNRRFYDPDGNAIVFRSFPHL